MFTATLTLTIELAVKKNADRKDLVVIRAAFFHHLVLRRVTLAFLAEFLEATLRINPGAIFKNLRQWRNDVLGNKCFGSVITLVEVNTTNDGLYAVSGYQGTAAVVALGFTAAQFEIWFKLKLNRNDC